MFEYGFMVNAFEAGTVIAAICGIISYFVIIRRTAFAAHALGHISLTGAAGSVLIGLSPFSGLLIINIFSGIIMGFIGDKIKKSDLAVGIVLTFFLGFGSYFLYLYQTGYSGSVMAILFGDILSVSEEQLHLLYILSFVVIAALVFTMRPLLYASIDPVLAESKNIPIKLLSIIFFVLLAITISMACQIVGALLIFALLIGPGAIASQWCDGFYRTIVVSILVAVVTVWLSLVVSFYINLPTGFCITMFITLFYAAGLVQNKLTLDR